MAALAAVALLAGACATAEDATTEIAPGSIPNELEAAETPVDGGTLVAALPSDPAGWNPVINQWPDVGAMMGSTVLEPLVVLDPDGNPEPFLAESITNVDPEFTQWDIAVKPDIVFHNGDALDAEVVKRNLDASFQTGLTKVALAPMYDRVEITGPNTVRVHLKKPWAQYPQILTTTGWMLAPEMLDHVDDAGVADGGSKTPIGTGPFRFVEWSPGNHLRVAKFDRYWRKDANGATLPHLDAIEFRPVVDDASRARALESGDIAFLFTTSAQTAAQASPDDTVIRDFNTGRTYVVFNTAVGPTNEGNPFTNVHARKAVAHATDRHQIAGLVGEGVASTPVPFRPDSQWYLEEDDAGVPPYDPAKAAEEVEAYKQDTGAEKLSFTFKGLPSAEVASLMQVLQQQWSAVGIESSIEQIDTASYTTNIVAGNYQAAWLRGYQASDPDGNYIFHSAETIAGVGGLNINFSQFTSPTLQENLLIGRSTTDVATRKPASDAVIREINEESLNVWLFDTPNSIIAAPQVRGLDGFRTHPFGNPYAKPFWADVWLRPGS